MQLSLAKALLKNCDRPEHPFQVLHGFLLGVEPHLRALPRDAPKSASPFEHNMTAIHSWRLQLWAAQLNFGITLSQPSSRMSSNQALNYLRYHEIEAMLT